VAAGQFKELVQYVSKEIDYVTAEEAWYDRWRQEGSLPDYSGVRYGLRELLDAGRADDVVALGKRLFRKAQEQVGMSHDDGETAGEVADTMKIVYQALREFLDKGKLPQYRTGGWPLPETGLERQRKEKTPRPARAEVRIEIALLREREIDRALSVYKTKAKSTHSHWGWGGAKAGGIHEDFAQAVAKRYPDEAIAIWKRLVKGSLPRKNRRFTGALCRIWKKSEDCWSEPAGRMSGIGF